MQFEHDEDANAVYVQFPEHPGHVARTVPLDDDRIIDYAADGTPIGVELLNVSLGVNLDDLPARDELAALMAEHHIRVYA